MKPILKEYAQSTDCTNIAFKDVTPVQSTLPSFIILKVSSYNKDEDVVYITIDNNTTINLTQFLTGTVFLLNSNTLGKTISGDSLIELNCGLIRIEYHWITTTSKTISFVKGKNELTGTNLDIKDSVYIQGKLYTINRSKSTSTKLITIEPLATTGSSILVYGEFNTYYFINKCAIMRGHTIAAGKLDILNCDDESKGCLGLKDKDKVTDLLRDLIQLDSAQVKINCGDYSSANQLIKDLCNRYAKECYNANSLLSNGKCKDIVVTGCTTCS